jgi:4-hydroxythreonine-4-phosphate dehydrogenase
VLLTLAAHRDLGPLVAVADAGMLRDRARALGLTLDIRVHDESAGFAGGAPGRLLVLPVDLTVACAAGEPRAANAGYVLETLRVATCGCLEGRFSGLVTGPVNKALINEAGLPFSGHTEFLASMAGIPLPVMLLCAPGLRVALATTHVPLAEVSGRLNRGRLEQILRVLVEGLETRFGLAAPRILVCGLNPHAGERGHLGREEIEIIEPVLETLTREGMLLTGPLPADTAFTAARLAEADAVLAMYHDQGLPVLKALGFGCAVNVTLGLPFVRTSVDHGTAYELAGSGRAEPGSLEAALALARELVALSSTTPSVAASE